RNVFLFIQRYFVFLVFLVLQGVALWMLFKYNRFHKAAFLGVASEVTGSINSRVDIVDDYFHLSEENRRLHRMNDSLLNRSTSNFTPLDTTATQVTDSIRYDTITAVRRYLYRDAKVVYNSINEESNYLQLNRGATAGIRDNMAVINSSGEAVGVVVNVSPNFSQVMSLLHIKSRVTAALKKTGDYGTLEWDAEDPRYLTLKGLPRNIDVKRGDTVVTSVYSYNFPPGFMVGRVEAIQTEKASGFYVLKIKTAVNFSSIQQVFVVENLQRDEQLQLMQATEQKIEQKK
ncbi:MAG TPA: rod shape-determining protein MreC, partial [Chitinophagaceae bacterium]|nr:rod shape-determining protein MreC [Chitinophagaceae bacterium]